ncbi:serine integrase family protein [Halobellus captivus]|uniref:resolvase n=1 Tax=Halobellus captivus TaxID=2592614 RepID=UPI0011A80563|nr:resolvase [Halobellus captivus]
MSRALAWIRKSKGSDDDIGLQEQRDAVHQLAAEVADEVETLDLGVQTGFSSLTRDGDAELLLDEHPQVQDTVERLREGTYDYVVAWDDNRISRDGYFEVIRHAAGDADFVYVGDVAEDDLTHDLKRRIERDTKEDEIEKSIRAIEERKERGYDHGRPKFGMTYDEQGHYQVPGEDFGKVREILRRRDRGETYAKINDDVGVSESTARNVVGRRHWYSARTEI